MTIKDMVWKREDLGKRYLEGVRSAIPLTDYQIEIILTLIQKLKAKPHSFLDLGCGDGVLGRDILSKYPKAQGVFLDFSDTMMEAALNKDVSARCLALFLGSKRLTTVSHENCPKTGHLLPIRQV